MRMCFFVDMYAYVCMYTYMCIFLQLVLRAVYRCSENRCTCSCMCYTDILLTLLYTSVTHSLQVVHICVCTYIYVYACMRMCVHDIVGHVEASLLRFSVCV